MHGFVQDIEELAGENNITAVPSFQSDVRTVGSKVSVKMSASTAVPEGIKIPLRLEGANGEKKTVRVDPTKDFTADAGFPVKKTTWDPDPTTLAFVR